MRWLALLALLISTAHADTFPHVTVIGASTCMRIDGNVTPLFMAVGTCVDPTEGIVQETLAAGPATLLNLACVASADPGTGRTITVTGRSGTCGAQTSASFTCILSGGAGVPTCTSGTAKLSVTTGQCWDLQLGISSVLVTPVSVQCTLERPL